MERGERRKEKGLKKIYYDKNKVKISQEHVEKKSKMSEEKRTRASLNTGCRGGAATATAKMLSTERVSFARKKQQQKRKNKEKGLARKDLGDIMTRNELAYLQDNP